MMCPGARCIFIRLFQRHLTTVDRQKDWSKHYYMQNSTRCVTLENMVKYIFTLRIYHIPATDTHTTRMELRLPQDSPL
jgi:hypothetical protein